MLDHAALSASQGPLTLSSLYGLRYPKQRENSVIVSDLSASAENLQKNLLSLKEAIQGNFAVASSLVLTEILGTGYSWEEKRSSRFLCASLLQLLKQWYILRKPNETLQLLEMYPFLNSYLIEIYQHIGAYFPEAKLFLEAVGDPDELYSTEGIGSNESLVISIVTHISPREAMKQLLQFYRDWWLKDLKRAQTKGKISFNLETA
jgi:hypothetical protein